MLWCELYVDKYIWHLKHICYKVDNKMTIDTYAGLIEIVIIRAPKYSASAVTTILSMKIKRK